MRIEKDFTFEAAHRLPLMAHDHKCRRLHGHTYKVTIAIFGEPDPRGVVVDFDDLSAAWQPLHDLLDHRCLNDVHGLNSPQPTAEVIARFIAERIYKELVWRVYCFAGGMVTVHETCDARAFAPIASPAMSRTVSPIE